MGPVPPTGTKTIKSGSLANLDAASNSFDKPTDAVILFLQGKNDTLARQLCTDSYMPKASRFQQ